MQDDRWDTVIVGAGPAGCAAAAGRLRHDPAARVLLLDRAEFPRDKPCGDGIAAQALDLLRELDFDLDAITAGYPPIHRLRLCSPGGVEAERQMAAAVRVIPRLVLDHRLVADVLGRGAVLRRHTVRTIHVGAREVVVDGHFRARTLIGADGAESTVRRSLGLPANGPGRVAVAIRGYAPHLPGQDDVQVITMTARHWPAYAWSFPIGGGRANVGYGELVGARSLTRRDLLERMHGLLPHLTAEPERLRGHRLPLSTHRPALSTGRVLLVGDAGSLINPLSGEGIFYALRSGALAGLAAGHAGADAGDLPAGHASDSGVDAGDLRHGGDPEVDAAALHRRWSHQHLGRHLRHSTALARLSRWPALLDAGVRGAAADQRAFDDLVRLGLADGPITLRLLAALARHGPALR